MESQPPGGVKVFVFDAYGTLFDVYSVTSLCEELFPGSGAALAQLWRTKQLQYTTLRSLMGRYENFWQVTLDALVYAANSLRLDLSADNRKRLMDAYLSLRLFPDVRPGLQTLNELGVRLAILSNGEPHMLEAVAKSAGIRPLLEAILSADEVRVFKPSPAVYKLAYERMHVERHEVGFVSSNSWDVNGAASAGLNTFWIQRTGGDPPEELGFSGGRVVKALTELAAFAGV